MAVSCRHGIDRKRKRPESSLRLAMGFACPYPKRDGLRSAQKKRLLRPNTGLPACSHSPICFALQTGQEISPLSPASWEADTWLFCIICYLGGAFHEEEAHKAAVFLSICHPCRPSQHCIDMDCSATFLGLAAGSEQVFHGFLGQGELECCLVRCYALTVAVVDKSSMGNGAPGPTSVQFPQSGKIDS